MVSDDDFKTHHAECLERQNKKVKEELQDEHADLLLGFLYGKNPKIECSRKPEKHRKTHVELTHSELRHWSRIHSEFYR